jgi:hypothetical protein
MYVCIYVCVCVCVCVCILNNQIVQNTLKFLRSCSSFVKDSLNYFIYFIYFIIIIFLVRNRRVKECF